MTSRTRRLEHAHTDRINFTYLFAFNRDTFTLHVLQPLDVVFNLQYKNFAKKIQERANIERRHEELLTRRGILNVQSLLWNQLSSPAYRDMLIYAWHSTDPNYSNDELDVYLPPMLNQVNRNLNKTRPCEVDQCQNLPFIRCAYCGKQLCLHHFLNRTCFHDSPNDFIEGRGQLDPGSPLPEPDFDDGVFDDADFDEWDFIDPLDLTLSTPQPPSSTPGPSGAACPVG